MKHTNALINETSPYLLQHASNPVDWLPWNEETLNKAKNEDKPLLISIGYSACHWCHVMEHESFEDDSIAQVMNKHFVCIKVDREERPDVDQVYMDAVQLMTQRGGWPLNCFALPDGRPFFGGTYFPKDQWLNVLENVAKAYTERRSEVEDYANQLLEGMSEMNAMPVQPIPERFSDEAIEVAVSRWKKSFDLEYGGRKGAPKFPMPNNLLFLLQYGTMEGDQDVLGHVHNTLQKMAYGGIYDQIGGGFARYSTDEAWKVPHFEKMLYDNGQLLSLYSDAYKTKNDPLYLDIINGIAEFIQQDMTSNEHSFYSALDADSEGEEGKFYIWNEAELREFSGEDFELIADYYNINGRGLWENGHYILLRHDNDDEVASRHQISEAELNQRIARFNSNLLAKRAKRERPGLDDKCLTSWNALTIKGFTDAYNATENEAFLRQAEESMRFLLAIQKQDDGSLFHSYKSGKSTINGYLEDYAATIDALITLYEATFNKTYLDEAQSLAIFVREHFDRNEAGLFYFKSKQDAELVTKKVELEDNVIPSSNALLSYAFIKLGTLIEDHKLISIAETMLAAIEPNFARYPSSYSQWMRSMLLVAEPFYEIAVVGADCEEKRKALAKTYIPNSVLCGSKHEENLPLLENRYVEGRTPIYVCQKGACQMPVDEVERALEQIK